ncbi:MAG: hypothetical protein OXF75_14090 [Acidimicrobiaceae bacterium]|nr:hypothetical protein [Acidimicrobiaceae bacterium]
MCKRLSIPGALLATVVVLSLTSGCAKDWPDEFPDAKEWQQRSAPLDLLDGREPGVAYAVSVYASRRERPPVAEQQKYRDARRVPSRLDVACIDGDGDGFGDIAVNVSLSQPILEIWHPRTWERWHLQFSTTDDSRDVQVELSDSASLLDGFVPHLYTPALVAEAMEGFRNFAGKDRAVVTVRADFPLEDASPPLEWVFDLGPDSRADELLGNLVEVCGGNW